MLNPALEAIKMLIYLFLAILSQSTSYEINTPNEYSENSDSNLEKCICYNNSADTIADKIQSLSPGNSNIERVVVYIYKESTTNKFYMYTPKREKQHSFPELSFDAGDELSLIGPETLTELVHTSSNRIITNVATSTLADANDEHNTEYGRYDHDTQSSSDTEDEEYLEQSKNQVDESAYSDEPSTNITPKNLYGLYNNQHTAHKPYDAYINSPTISEQSSFNEDSYYNSQKPYDAYIDSPSISEQSSFNEDFASKTHPILSHYNEHHVPFRVNENVPGASYNDHAFSEIYTTNKEEQSENSTSGVKQTLEQVPSVPEDVDVDELETESYTPVAPVPTDNLISEDDEIVNDITTYDNLLPRPVEKYITFDKWFDQQMYRINKTGKTSNKNIALSSLKLLVEKSLYDNHMYITKDGVLIDSYGNPLNVANLKLRPILIGNSVSNSILLNVKDNKVELPPDLPYLEAVLVSLVYPPKVLGVIPLGYRYVPRISYRRVFNFWPARRLPAYCASGQCSTEDPLFVFRKASPHRHNKRHRYNHINSHSKSKLGSRAKPRGNRQRYSKHQLSHTPSQDFVFEAQTDPNNKQDIFKALKSLLNLNNKFPHDELRDDYPYEYEADDDYETPDFRIIGGSAATGSGTPVSSRGRSGFPL